jgi:hypothetical protein
MGSLAEASLLLVPVSFEETSERRVNSKTDVSKYQMASDGYSETPGKSARLSKLTVDRICQDPKLRSSVIV